MTGTKISIISECFKAILGSPSVKFLKEIVTSSKLVVLQMDRTQYTSMREYAKTLELQ
jgi:hypothetical protein